jgi:predicted DNA-binding protein
MKQTSVQLSERCRQQIAELAELWGYTEARHLTAVIERGVTEIYMLEIGYNEYLDRMGKMEQAKDIEETNQVDEEKRVWDLQKALGLTGNKEGEVFRVLIRRGYIKAEKVGKQYRLTEQEFDRVVGIFRMLREE